MHVPDGFEDVFIELCDATSEEIKLKIEYMGCRIVAPDKVQALTEKFISQVLTCLAFETFGEDDIEV